jgi:hypothetical protein
MEIGHMVHVSRHRNWTHGTGIRTWKQDTWDRYQDMDTQAEPIAQVSGHGNRTHGTGIRMEIGHMVQVQYQDMKTGNMATTSGHGNRTYICLAQVSGHENRTGGTGLNI